MEDTAIGVALVDIDNFRLLNETYGHEAGDEAIRTAVGALRRALPGDVAFGRYGPDELLLIAPAGPVASMVGVLERLRTTLADHALQFGASERLPLTISAGVCIYPDHGDWSPALPPWRSRSRRRRRAAATPSAWRPEEAEPETRSFDVFQGLIFAVDTKDRYTKQHSEDVARYGVFLAVGSASSRTHRHHPRRGALHDVGKIGIPDHILRKPGTLTAAEYDVVKQHVASATSIVRDLPDVDVIRAGSVTTTSAGTATAIRTPGRRGDPAGRPDPGRRRRVLGDDDDQALPQGDERRGGAASPRGRRRHAARGAPGHAVRRRDRDGGGRTAARRRRRLAATVGSISTGPVVA